MNKSRKRKIFSWWRGGIFVLVAIYAYASTVVRIDKAKIRLSLSPEEVYSGQLNIENPSSEPLKVKVYLQDWRYLPTADGTKEFFPPSSTEFSCADWIKFSPSEFTLGPFGKKSVNYTVKTPSEFRRAHFAVLFFETVPAANVEVGMVLKVRLGALFFIEPKGTAKRDIELEDFKVTQNEHGQLLIEAQLKNTGNVDLICEGLYHIMDKKGMVFARGEFNKVYTFPFDKAKIKAIWKEPLKKGIYDLVITLDIGKAQEEAGMSRGPVIVKECRIEFDESGSLINVGQLQ